MAVVGTTLSRSYNDQGQKILRRAGLGWKTAAGDQALKPWCPQGQELVSTASYKPVKKENHSKQRQTRKIRGLPTPRRLSPPLMK